MQTISLVFLVCFLFSCCYFCGLMCAVRAKTIIWFIWNRMKPMHKHCLIWTGLKWLKIIILITIDRLEMMRLLPQDTYRHARSDRVVGFVPTASSYWQANKCQIFAIKLIIRKENQLKEKFNCRLHQPYFGSNKINIIFSSKMMTELLNKNYFIFVVV